MNAPLALCLFLLAYPLAVYPLALALLCFCARPASSAKTAPRGPVPPAALAKATPSPLESVNSAPPPLGPVSSGPEAEASGGAGSAQPWPPTVSVLLSVYNEEAALPAKLENFLALDHPPDRLELVVVSDGSTDGTDDLVRRFAAARSLPAVRLLRQEGRLGKTSALNLAAAQAGGEVLLFTDADALFAPDCPRRLLEPFLDPDVGLVGGRSVYLDEGGGESAGSLYRRFEEWLKEREGRLFGIIGADGAVYALRRELYEPLASECINDLAHPVRVALAGKKSVAAPDALVREPASPPGGEMARQTRIMAQSWLVFLRHWRALARGGRWGFLWQFVSHKLLRWLALPCMLLALIAALCQVLPGALPAASSPPGGLALLTLAGFALFGVFALCGARGGGGRPGRLAWLFWVQSAAAMLGLRRLLRGERFVVWSPRAD